MEIIIPIAIWFGVAWSFVAVMHGKHRMQQGGLTLFWKVHLLPLGVIGVLLDWAFNWTFGFMFVDWPKNWSELFSHRVQRNMTVSGWRGRLAKFWARQLNQMDPGHIE